VKKREICYFLKTGGPGPNLLPPCDDRRGDDKLMRKKKTPFNKGYTFHQRSFACTIITYPSSLSLPATIKKKKETALT
jgi:hypothetical protein